MGHVGLGGARAALGEPQPIEQAPAKSQPPAAAPSPEVLEQLRKLGERRKAGVLTDAEFQAEKAELLGRI